MVKIPDGGDQETLLDTAGASGQVNVVLTMSQVSSPSVTTTAALTVLPAAAQPIRGQIGVTLQRADVPPTDDLALWVAIRNHAKAISFGGISKAPSPAVIKGSSTGFYAPAPAPPRSSAAISICRAQLSGARSWNVNHTIEAASAVRHDRLRTAQNGDRGLPGVVLRRCHSLHLTFSETGSSSTTRNWRAWGSPKSSFRKRLMTISEDCSE